MKDTPEILEANELSDEYIETSLSIVETYFRSIGGELRQAQQGSMSVQYKADNSPFTELDQKVEEELKTLITMYDPTVGFYGEESGISGNKQTYWLIDPIDSTKKFIENQPGSTNMAVLMHNGKPQCAVVFDFYEGHEVMYTATEKNGALKNGEPLITRSTEAQPTIWIDCMDKHRRDALYARASELGFTPSDLAPPNGARLVELGQSLDVQVCIDPNAGPYDLVPGLYIAQKSGVEVRNIGSESWDPLNLNVIASVSKEQSLVAESLVTSQQR
jgi:fructose-1,6-bisphosphatase/inositol monophosphatase family enzyme